MELRGDQTMAYRNPSQIAQHAIEAGTQKANLPLLSQIVAHVKVVKKEAR
jgi:hypothetical protein